MSVRGLELSHAEAGDSRNAPLRIVVTVDPYLPVPPRHYGGIERVVDSLVRGLERRGHAVTLVAHPDSQTPARLIAYGRPPHVGWRARTLELVEAGGAVWRQRLHVDVVHSFGRLAALLPILPLRWLPKIQSYQRDGVPWRSVAHAVRLSGQSLTFTGCSSSVYRHHPGDPTGGCWQTVFNGVDVERYTPREQVPADAPLVFLGRLDPIKGAHDAIAIARIAGRRLVIAGTRSTGAEHAYFDERIAPQIDGRQTTYLGAVDDGAKDELLGRAAALLMPIAWEEPFGIVMPEALACGTPVVAFARGSAPEVVRDGVNGYLCRNVEEAAAAVSRLDRIDRRAVRADCEARFGSDVIVDAYVALYRAAMRRAADRDRRVA